MKIGGKFTLIKMIAMVMLFVACSGNDEEQKNEEPQPAPQAMESVRLKVSVIDYFPAPGQFVNVIPEYEEGDTRESMNQKATESLCNGDLISLGAWGGYVIIKLPNSLPNVEDKPDFRVVGNAVYANDASNAIRIGSAEPGIVMIMQDINQNGLPDDTWYELKGGETTNGIDNYQVMYHYPKADATDENYIEWIAENGDSGFLNRTTDYQQDYFPMWIEQTGTLIFRGRKLPDNGSFNVETNRFDLVSYNGYADSHPNNVEASCLDIDNAIDCNGNKVRLESVDFIKIYTGVLQSNGPLGECSTEVAAIEQIVYK